MNGFGEGARHGSKHHEESINPSRDWIADRWRPWLSPHGKGSTKVSDETWERGIDEEGVEDHSSQAQVFCFLPPQIDPNAPMGGRRMETQSPPGISFLVHLCLASGIG